MSTVRLVLIGEYKLFRECLAAMLGDYDLTETVGQFDDLHAARESMVALRPDLVLFDVGTMEETTVRALEDFTEEFSACKVIALGLREVEADILRLIEAGDNPFLCRTRPEFDRLCELIFHGPSPLAGIAQTFLCRDQIERRELFTKMWSDLHARTERLEPILESIEAPTRVIWGHHDRVLHPTGMDTFARHVRDIDTAGLDCGHAPPVECPAELARNHAELLSRLATR